MFDLIDRFLFKFCCPLPKCFVFYTLRDRGPQGGPQSQQDSKVDRHRFEWETSSETENSLVGLLFSGPAGRSVHLAIFKQSGPDPGPPSFLHLPYEFLLFSPGGGPIVTVVTSFPSISAAASPSPPRHRHQHLHHHHFALRLPPWQVFNKISLRHSRHGSSNGPGHSDSPSNFTSVGTKVSKVVITTVAAPVAKIYDS